MVRVRQGAIFCKSVQKYPHYESVTPSWVLDFQVRQQGKLQNIYDDSAHASSHDFLCKPERLRRQYTARNNCVGWRVLPRFNSRETVDWLTPNSRAISACL